MVRVSESSPVALYDFAETSGTLAADSSGNGHDGVYVGGRLHTGIRLATALGPALEADALHGGVTVSPAPGLSATARTYSLFVCDVPAPAHDVPYGLLADGGGVSFTYSSADLLAFQIYTHTFAATNAAGATTSASVEGFATTGAPMHFAATIDTAPGGAGLVLYKNGAAISSTPWAGGSIAAGSGPLVLGSTAAQDAPSPGAIDQVQLFSRILSPLEIIQLATAPAPLLPGCAAGPTTTAPMASTTTSTSSSTSSGPSTSSSIPLFGPVAAYGFAETSGTLAADSSGNGHDGIYVGGRLHTGIRLATALGPALEADALHGGVTVSPAPGLSATARTYSLFVCDVPTPSYDVPYGLLADGGGVSFTYSGTNGGLAQLYTYTFAATNAAGATTSVPGFLFGISGAPMHFAATIDTAPGGAGLVLYKNGAAISSMPWAGGSIAAGSGPLVLGSTAAQDAPSPGAIDQVQLFSRILSPAEIAALATAPAPLLPGCAAGPTPSPATGTTTSTSSTTTTTAPFSAIAVYKFSEQFGALAADSSGNGHDGIYVGGRLHTGIRLAAALGPALEADALHGGVTVSPAPGLSATARTYSLFVCDVLPATIASPISLLTEPGVAELTIRGFNTFFQTVYRFHFEIVNDAGVVVEFELRLSGDDQPLHLAVTVQILPGGGAVTAFINGVVNTIVPWPGGNIAMPTGPLILGNNAAMTAPALGAIDDVELYSRALTYLEINDLATAPAPLLPGCHSPSVTPSTQLPFTTTTTPPAPQGPVALYDFAETSGTLAADSSGNGHDGVYVGGRLHTGIRLATALGPALEADALHGGVTVSPAPGLSATARTYSLFVCDVPAPAHDVPYGLLADGGGVSFTYSSADLLAFQIYTHTFAATNAAGATTSASVEGFATTGAPMHFAATIDTAPGGAGLVLYKNGAAISSTPWAGGSIAAGSGPLVLGSTAAQDAPSPGAIDQVQLFSRILSPLEIIQLATAPAPLLPGCATGPTTTSTTSTTTFTTTVASTTQRQLVRFAAYDFAETSGTLAADSSGNGHDGIYVGGRLHTGIRLATALGPALEADALHGGVTVSPAPGLSATARTYSLFVCDVPTPAHGVSYGLLAHEGVLSVSLSSLDLGSVQLYTLDASVLDTAGTSMATAFWTFTVTNRTRHVAITVDTTLGISLFVDGSQVDSVAWSGGSLGSATGPFVIGNNPLLSSPSPGAIDQVELFNRALTAAEIHDLASSRGPLLFCNVPAPSTTGTTTGSTTPTSSGTSTGTTSQATSPTTTQTTSPSTSPSTTGTTSPTTTGSTTPIPAAHPVVSYGFGETSGVVATDSAGGGHHGVYIGGRLHTGIRFSSELGAALEMDASHGGVTVGTLPPLQTSGRTYSLLYCSEARDDTKDVSLFNHDALFRLTLQYVDLGNAMYVVYVMGFADSNGHEQQVTVPWYGPGLAHLVITLDSTEGVRVYNNGVLAHSSPWRYPGALRTTGPNLEVGDTTAVSIDQMEIFDEALSPGQAVALYHSMGRLLPACGVPAALTTPTTTGTTSATTSGTTTPTTSGTTSATTSGTTTPVEPLDAVARYPFAETSGVVAGDASGNGHHGVFNGGRLRAGVRFSQSLGPALEAGLPSVGVAVDPAPQLSETTRSYSMWVCDVFTPAHGTEYFLLQQDGAVAISYSSEDRGPFRIYTYKAVVQTAAGSALEVAFGRPVPTGDPIHIALTVDTASSIRLFHNGVEQGAAAWTGGNISSSVAELRLGYGSPATHSFPGAIDDVAIFDAVLEPRHFGELLGVAGALLPNCAAPAPSTTATTTGTTSPTTTMSTTATTSGTTTGSTTGTTTGSTTGSTTGTSTPYNPLVLPTFITFAFTSPPSEQLTCGSSSPTIRVDGDEQLAQLVALGCHTLANPLLIGNVTNVTATAVAAALPPSFRTIEGQLEIVNSPGLSAAFFQGVTALGGGLRVTDSGSFGDIAHLVALVPQPEPIAILDTCYSPGALGPLWWLRDGASFSRPLASCPTACEAFDDGALCTSSCPGCGQICAGGLVSRSAEAVALGGCEYVFGNLLLQDVRATEVELEALAGIREVGGLVSVRASPSLVGLEFLRGLQRASTVVIAGNDNLLDARLPRLNASIPTLLQGNRQLCATGGPFGRSPCGLARTIQPLVLCSDEDILTDREGEVAFAAAVRHLIRTINSTVDAAVVSATVTAGGAPGSGACPFRTTAEVAAVADIGLSRSLSLILNDLPVLGLVDSLLLFNLIVRTATTDGSYRREPARLESIALTATVQRQAIVLSWTRLPASSYTLTLGRQPDADAAAGVDTFLRQHALPSAASASSQLLFGAIFFDEPIEAGNRTSWLVPECRTTARLQCIHASATYEARVTTSSGVVSNTHGLTLVNPALQTSGLAATELPDGSVHIAWGRPNASVTGYIATVRMRAAYNAARVGLAGLKFGQVVRSARLREDATSVLLPACEAFLGGHCFLPYTVYEVDVEALDRNFFGRPETIRFTTRPRAPESPARGVRVTAVGVSTLSGTAQLPELINGFADTLVVRATQLSTATETTVRLAQTRERQVSFPDEELAFEVAGLLPLRETLVSVAAAGPAGTGPFSAPVVATTLPVNPTIDAVRITSTDRGFLVGWTPSFPHEQATYQVRRYPLDNGAPELVYEGPIGQVPLSSLGRGVSVRGSLGNVTGSFGPTFSEVTASRRGASGSGSAFGLDALISVVTVCTAFFVVLIVWRTRRGSDGFKRPVPDEWEIAKRNVATDRKIGKGQFGVVWNGTVSNHPQFPASTEVAIKVCQDGAGPDLKMEFVKEMSLLKRLSSPWHKNVIRLIGVQTVCDPMMIVLEYAANGDLRSYLLQQKAQGRAVSIRSLLYLATDIANGMHFLEKMEFIHRDLAARNCLVSASLTVKIADFGMSRRADTQYYRKGGDALLPVRWMGPEALLDGYFSHKGDVWSFGVVLYEVFTHGGQPYPGKSNAEAYLDITKQILLEQPARCPDAVYEMMTSCWQWEPSLRPSFADLKFKLKALARELDSGDLQNAVCSVDVSRASFVSEGQQVLNGHGSKAELFMLGEESPSTGAVESREDIKPAKPAYPQPQAVSKEVAGGAQLYVEMAAPDGASTSYVPMSMAASVSAHAEVYICMKGEFVPIGSLAAQQMEEVSATASEGPAGGGDDAARTGYLKVLNDDDLESGHPAP